MATHVKYSPEQAQDMYLKALRRTHPSAAVVRVIDEIEREAGRPARGRPRRTPKLTGTKAKKQKDA